MHQWREVLHADVIAYEQSIIDANDLGFFYRFVNKRVASRSIIGAIVAVAVPQDGNILTDNHEKANHSILIYLRVLRL